LSKAGPISEIGPAFCFDSKSKVLVEIVRKRSLTYFKPVSTTLFLYEDTTLKEERKFELFMKTVFAFLEKCIFVKTSNSKIFAKTQDNKLGRKDRVLSGINQVLFNNQLQQTMSANSKR